MCYSYGMRIGKENPNWKGGKLVASNGYVIVRVGKDHHLSDIRGYAYEHRIVAESKLGRRLEDGEQIHHINGNRSDNRPENIEVCQDAAHHLVKHRKASSRLRLIGEENPVIQCNCGCGQWFNKYDNSGRPRLFISGHNTEPREPQKRFLDAVLEPASILEISARTGQSPAAVKVMASKLVQEGKLKRIARGIYGKTN